MAWQMPRRCRRPTPHCRMSERIPHARAYLQTKRDALHRGACCPSCLDRLCRVEVGNGPKAPSRGLHPVFRSPRRQSLPMVGRFHLLAFNILELDVSWLPIRFQVADSFAIPSRAEASSRSSRLARPLWKAIVHVFLEPGPGRRWCHCSSTRRGPPASSGLRQRCCQRYGFVMEHCSWCTMDTQRAGGVLFVVDGIARVRLIGRLGWRMARAARLYRRLHRLVGRLIGCCS